MYLIITSSHITKDWDFINIDEYFIIIYTYVCTYNIIVIIIITITIIISNNNHSPDFGISYFLIPS